MRIEVWKYAFYFCNSHDIDYVQKKDFFHDI